MNIRDIAGKRSESQIVSALMQYLLAKKLFAWRQNNGGVFNQKRQAFMKNPNTLKGIPDIFAMMSDGVVAKSHYNPKTGEGAMLTVRVPKIYAIEAKTLTGKLSEDQKNFKRRWELEGGIYIVARSVDDLIKAGL